MLNCIYAISAGHEKTLEIAESILKEGGNAFDAAIAAHLAMYLTEPCMASAGAGGFALCHHVEHGTMMLDFFTQTPLSSRMDFDPDFRSILVNFGNESEEFHIGLASMATPGSVDGMFKLYERFASMPFEDIIAPVQDLARIGLAINKFQSIDIGLLEDVFASDPSVNDIFFNSGQILREGDHFILPHFSDFLDLLRYEGRDGFYLDYPARQIEKVCKENGGFLSRKDFESYTSRWVKVLEIPFKGVNVILPNLPCVGGLTMALLLKTYQEKGEDWLRAIYDFKACNYNFTQLAQAFSHAFPGQLKPTDSDSNFNRGTSHFNIMDKYGNAIALTCTLGEGSGYFIPGTDMQMNNMLGEAFLVPQGFHKWTPDTRLNSMMTPTMVKDKNRRLRFICGSGGAGRIPYMISQMIHSSVIRDMKLEDAMMDPRIYLYANAVQYETGYKGNIEIGLAHKEWKDLSLFFGGVHAIKINEDNSVEAEGDPRRFGAASIGYE